MQTRNKLLVALCVIFCASCATPISDKAASVQVHRQTSTLLNDCKKIGPVAGSGKAAPGVDSFEAARRVAREKAADMGADTIAVLGSEGDVLLGAAVQAVAYRCY